MSPDRRQTQRPARSDGFTLIEVMATLVIITVVLLSILAIRTRNLQDAAHAKNTRHASLVAQRALEEALMGIEPELDELPAGFNVIVSNLVETVGEDEDVIQVLVEVTYPGADGDESLILSSYRLPFEGEDLGEEEE